LRNPSNQAAPFVSAIYEKTAKSLGIELKMMDAANPDQLKEVLSIPLEGRFKTALLATPESLFVAGRTQIVEYAQRQHLPLFAPIARMQKQAPSCHLGRALTANTAQ
jgi:putative ABC transport system substrate-binding protein